MTASAGPTTGVGGTALPMGRDAHVVIIGGGFSGALLAANIVRFNGPRLTLVERAPERLARGVAYSGAHPSQLLNVRAAGMSAFADDPGHFVRWLEARGGGRQHFVARAIYGQYLADLLDTARGAAGDRLSIIHDAATAIEAGPRVRLQDGATIDADAIVLSVGNLPPHTPPGIDPAALPVDLYLDDPWTCDPAKGLSSDDRVLLIGSGLTAIDVALKLDAAGFRGEILALSRRGLAPHRHVDGVAPPQGSREAPDRPLSDLVRSVRREATEIGWRSAIDALRPITQHWWARRDARSRARFLRHLRPFWDIHRHRLAPAVADRIDAMLANSRLSFAAGKIVGTQPVGLDAAVAWRPRGGDRQVTTIVRRIVNCTGPQGDIARSKEPLVVALAGAGVIRPDALNLGIDVNARSQVIDMQGRHRANIYCIGPMTRGHFWEIVAVPDIRRQAADLARRLSNAQWTSEGL